MEALARDDLLKTARELMVEAQALSTRIAVLNEIATAINETLELSQILRVVKKKAKWLLDFSYCSVVVRRENRWQLEHLTGRPLTTDMPFLPEHPIGETLHTGRPYRNTPPEEMSFQSFLSVPIKLGPETIGCLNFGNDELTYDQDDVRIAYMLCQQLAAAIRNTMQFEELTRTYDELHAEQEKSESLLRNILPATVAEELKENGRVRPVHYARATVLFTDFRGFTGIARQTKPAELVEKLNWYFTRFDDLCAQHGIEKLKTIGDAYMCVSGVPTADDDHAIRMIRMAAEMLEIIAGEDAPGWEMRIGLHSGELVAGVIGQRKFSYDVWGDTVNVAARVESHGRPGHINLSADTRALVQEQIECLPGDKVHVHNIGEMQLYYVA